VDRDRRRRGGVARTVDVAGRRESAHVADVMLVLADPIQVGVEQFLSLGSVDHAQHTPRRDRGSASLVRAAAPRRRSKKHPVRFDIEVVAQ
jgi:hypothetical protein